MHRSSNSRKSIKRKSPRFAKHRLRLTKFEEQKQQINRQLTKINDIIFKHHRHRYTQSNAESYGLAINQIVGQKYKITKQLGIGTFGKVYEVKSMQSKCRYAVKVIKPVLKYVEQALEECKVLDKLRKRDQQYNSFVKFRYYFLHKGYFCMMFYPLGPSLQDVLRKNNYQPYKYQDAKNILYQLFHHLALLHAIGYTHADLKPQNILFLQDRLDFIYNPQMDTIESEEEKVDKGYYRPSSTDIRIIDFGGAVRFNQNRTGTVCTRQYRPPQVIMECEAWTQRIDVWSIGCIAVELFSGSMLFRTHNSFEHLLMMERVSGPFPQWMINNSNIQYLHMFDDDGLIYADFVKDHIRDSSRISGLTNALTLYYRLDIRLGDLIRRCLTIDPHQRISCEEARRHSLFY